jgi:CheY-like chemotaxis protein
MWPGFRIPSIAPKLAAPLPGDDRSIAAAVAVAPTPSESPVEPEPLPPSQTDEAQILAYVRVLMEARVPLAVATEEGVELEALIENLDLPRARMGLLVLEGNSLGLEANKKLVLSFTMNANRWLARTAVYYHTDNRTRLSVHLPKEIQSGNRRAEPRLPLRPEDGVEAAFVLEHEEVQLRGYLEDLSAHGCRMVVLEARATKEERTLDPLALGLRDRVPLVGALTLGGLRAAPLRFPTRILNARADGGHLILGMRYRTIGATDLTFLRDFVESRAPEEAEQLPPLNARAPMPTPRPAEPEKPKVEGPKERQESVLQLKKRLRSIAVVTEPGPHRHALLGFLQRDGYAQVAVAAELGEISQAFGRGPVNLVLIHGPIPQIDSLALVSFVRRVQGERPCAVLLVEEPGRVDAESAREAGVDLLLPRNYMQPDFGVLLEEILDLRPRRKLAPPPPDPLLKRFMSIALVMPPGGPREALRAYLTDMGFMQIHMAGTVAELARLHALEPPDLLFVDWLETGLAEADLVHFLRQLPFNPQGSVVLACRQATEKLVHISPELGIGHLLVRPYTLDAALCRVLLQQGQQLRGRP